RPSGGGGRRPGGGRREPDAPGRDLLSRGHPAARARRVFRKERPEVVSHHAAQANLRRSIEDPAADGETNVLGTLRVLDLAARFGVKQVIFSSTGGALYGEPRSLPVGEDDPVLPMAPYGFHK